MRKRRKPHITKRQVARAKEAIAEYLRAGLTVTTACQLAGICKKTYYNWLRSDDLFAVQVDEALGAAIASAEQVIMSAIREGDTRVAMWFLEKRSPEYSNRAVDDDDGYVIEIVTPDDDGGNYKVELMNGTHE